MVNRAFKACFKNILLLKIFIFLFSINRCDKNQIVCTLTLAPPRKVIENISKCY